ncbi:TIGR02679 family protein [Glycomyces buryatensis]|uniref:TIGR02679 family protein n=1 Tax=Glycomyces buryatensis TaxID=2570927 RepID=A0A4S8Q9R5_9ACTN|nr:TIGR02679 family protein [Glycomyces buryatensis]
MNRPIDSPGWMRILTSARAGIERGSRTISISDPTETERRLLIGVTGKHRDTDVARIRVALADLDAYFTVAHGMDLTETITSVTGAAPRDRRAEAEIRQIAVAVIRTAAERSRHHGSLWYDAWLDKLTTSGGLTRLVTEGRNLTDICTALDALPADDEPLPAFAERVLGDTKALANGRTRSLLMSALAAWSGMTPPRGAEAERDLLEWAGVVPDDLASQVLVLNVPAEGGLVGRWLTEAAAVGIPMRITLHQLRLAPLVVDARELFVTENPAILREAARALGPDCPPLICTEGFPSAAAHRLLAAGDTANIHWRNDFDWTGLRICATALQRYPRATPWRMSAGDYRETEAGIELNGSEAACPWDDELTDAMRTRGRAVMEERLMPRLLADLADRAALRLLDVVLRITPACELEEFKLADYRPSRLVKAEPVRFSGTVRRHFDEPVEDRICQVVGVGGGVDERLRSLLIERGRQWDSRSLRVEDDPPTDPSPPPLPPPPVGVARRAADAEEPHGRFGTEYFLIEPPPGPDLVADRSLYFIPAVTEQG